MQRLRAALPCLGLAAAVLAVFGRVATHEFVPYDASLYLTENPWVLRGLTWDGARWAFTALHGLWHPLTWLSHMLDVEIFGLRPAGHHLVNVALHAANACLVFGVLARMTGERARSLAVAALFALHPLRVEAVAWVVERKDLLAAFFGLLTLACWSAWARGREKRAYLGALACFACSLMSKPMLVTWPLVLLLLDVWPLRRTHGGARPLVVEKLPFLALSIACAVLTLLAQSQSGAVQGFARFPIPVRLANALVAYAAYLWKLVWPSDLSFHYLHPGAEVGGARIVAAVLVLAGISALAVANARRAPWILVGWLFYLGTLVPTIGLVQVGGQAMADRFTYVPLVGITIAVVWTAADLVRARPGLRVPARLAAGAACAVLAFLAWRQVGVWKDAETLCAHAIAVDPRNHVAHDLLGAELVNQGRVAEGLAHLDLALRLAPHDLDARQNRAVALELLGRREEAEIELARVIAQQPERASFHLARGRLLLALARHGDARMEALETIRLAPGDPESHLLLSAVLAWQGDRDRALASAETALALATAAGDPEAARRIASWISAVQDGRVAPAAR